MTGPHFPATAIETASGRYLDLASPDPESIVLADVAHGLAHTCRYGGQTVRFYSVAEHAALVVWRLSQQGHDWHVRLAGLHHDDSEAFIGDVTRPLKLLLPAYRDLETRIEGAIAEALVLPVLTPEEWAAVKAADDWALFVEARELMPSRGEGWRDAPATVDRPPWVLGLSPDAARDEFLGLHAELGGRE